MGLKSLFELHILSILVKLYMICNTVLLRVVCQTIGVKKPAGTAEEIEKQFGCESSQLVMVERNLVELFQQASDFNTLTIIMPLAGW